MCLSSLLSSGMDQSDGDLGSVVRAGISSLGSFSVNHLLSGVDFDGNRHNVKRKAESGFSLPGSASPSSVLQCNSTLVMSEMSKNMAGDETLLSDVCNRYNYSNNAAPSYYSLDSGAASLDSSRRSYYSPEKSNIDRLSEAVVRNLQREVVGNRKEHTSDMMASSRSRLRPQTGLVDRQTNTLSQEMIKEDFFHGGSSVFNHRTNMSAADRDSSSEHLSNSHHSSPTREDVASSMKKIGHPLGAKLEDSTDTTSSISLASTKGSKRRKNQQKRIVCVPVSASGRPTSEGLPSDLWAWRKYGQKPIKGSPFPRGYYRCSSSKGCSARKQVERSRTDPTMLIITYTAEHNHPWPSHRNALAGSSRMSSLEKGNLPQEPKVETEESPLSVESPANSQETGGEEDMSSVLGERTVSENSESFTFHDHAQKEDRELVGSFHHLTCRSSVGMQDDDFFADLGELPESVLLFGRTGVMEDRSDDEGGNLGMDVDPYNLFCWSSSSEGAKASA